jgi:hypothetical protein
MVRDGQRIQDGRWPSIILIEGGMHRVNVKTVGPGQLLRSLFEATAMATGQDFFRELARQLAESLGAKVAMTSELVREGNFARTLAI